jgi:hypothetical protein
MRYRLPELIEKRGWTAYELATRSEGRIKLTTAYRLMKKKGRVSQFDGALVEALCDTMGVGIASLLERDKPKKGRRST